MRSAISRRRKSARARSRLATFAQAITRTMVATPAIQSGSRATGVALGPRASTTAPAAARGRAFSTGGVLELIARSAAQLRRYAFVRSAFAASTLTLGFRRTMIESHPQLYVL